METSQDSSCPHIIIWLAHLVFSTILNLAIILFIVYSFSRNESSSSATNVISLITLILYYIGLAVLYGLFAYSSGVWYRINQLIMGIFTIFCIIIGFPLFYIVSLPFAVFQFICWLGTPGYIWDTIFCNGCYSLQSFQDTKGHAGFTVLKGIYIGIPFIIFCILYVVFVIVLFPVILVLFAPYGFGTFGCCLHLWCIDRCQGIDVLFQFMNSTYLHCLIGNVYGISLPMMILSIVHVAIVGVTWYGIFLLVVSILYFVVFVIFTIFPLFGTSARQIV